MYEYEVKFTGQFKRDLELARKQGKYGEVEKWHPEKTENEI